MHDTATTPHETQAAERLERSYRIPLVATAVFVITMMAIWLMGRSLTRQYVPMLTDDGTELVYDGRP